LKWATPSFLPFPDKKPNLFDQRLIGWYDCCCRRLAVAVAAAGPRLGEGEEVPIRPKREMQSQKKKKKKNGRKLAVANGDS